MQNLMTILTITLALTLWTTLSWAQNDVIYLNSPVLGLHEKPLTKFTHAKHAKNIKCITCHHNYDQYFNLLDDSEGIACYECHKKIPTLNNPISLTVAFHRQCKGCHSQAIKTGKINAPIMCGECHNVKFSDDFIQSQTK